MALTEDLLSHLQGQLAWKWDTRFQMALMEFKVTQAEAVQAVLAGCLNQVWEKSTIGKAPKMIKQINKQMGGLKKGQYCFNSDAGQTAFLYALWWPWGDGKTISLRLAPWPEEQTTAFKQQLSL